MAKQWPSYLGLNSGGELERRVEALHFMLYNCRLCPHECGADRVSGERGLCNAPGYAEFASASAHGGEEPALSGACGSGTIFFTHCNSRCLFCQNYDISQLEFGREISEEGLADLYLALQQRGCHNVNFVTPAHYLPQIVGALEIAIARGFRLPLVYNSNGYDSVPVLRMLDGIVDIYLPDMKYGDDGAARSLSSLPGYTRINRAAVAEMFRQVGLLETDEHGIARRGLIIRHLVLPHDLAATEKVLESIAGIDPLINVSLMGQYYPAYRACDDQRLNRRLLQGEYDEAVEAMERLGLVNGWTQQLRLLDDTFKPDFPGRKWDL
jgi:putative pyruvate formate lyase activating enzyme